jgi:ribosomal protein S28E/S33
LIRNWFESHVNNFLSRVIKLAGRNGLAGEVRQRWMEVLYIVGIVLMTAGLVNAVLQPVNIGYVINPSTSDQSATETGVDALALLIGAVGIYLSYLSGRQTTKSRMVNFYLTIGLLMIAIAVYIGIYVLGSK